MLNAEHNVEAPPVAPELPDDRKDAAENGIKQYVTTYHLVAAERDALLREVRQLKMDNALLEVKVEGKDERITELESWVAAYRAERDAAVAGEAKHKTINASAMAVLRAGEVENVPLIKERNDDEPAIGGA